MKTDTRILVVDDDEIIRLSLLRSLRSDQRKVEVAMNGKTAINAMEQQPFDVVLLDLRMPGMDGMSVLKTIKKRWPESEVVIITGYPGIETAVEAVRLGAFDYLAKPVGPDEVIRAANSAATQKRWALREQQRVQAGEPNAKADARREMGNYVH